MCLFEKLAKQIINIYLLIGSNACRKQKEKTYYFFCINTCALNVCEMRKVHRRSTSFSSSSFFLSAAG